MCVIIVIIIIYLFCLGGSGGCADDCVVGLIRMDSKYLVKFRLCIVFNYKFEYLWNSGLCIVFNYKFEYLWNSGYVLFLIINLNICEIQYGFWIFLELNF